MNKNIQLCGIGNGIVDIQYQITEEELQSMHLPKSEMRLISSQDAIDLHKKLQHIKANRCGGGSASNTIDAFAKFGGTAAMLTVVADDQDGQFFYNELEKNNIKYKNNILHGGITSTCNVLITPDGERTMLTALTASEHFSKEHISEDLIKESEWLYAEGYVVSTPKSCEALYEAIELAKKYKTKIAFSASDVFIIDSFREDIEKILKDVNLLFCNEREAMTLTNTKSIETASSKLLEIYPKLDFVITQGKDGASIKIGNLSFNVEAEETNVIDATGAGDIFAGAFMYGLLNLNNSAKAALLASHAAAKHIATLGARYNDSFKELLSIIL
ncbi:MAG: adenosine kinase [Bacteroidetes bacterium]|nr:adenosine kinase [Bacteroidota bacterium]